MMDPSGLPMEVFDMVIDHATKGEHDYKLAKLLYIFSLVSRRWYARVAARLYSKWYFYTTVHPISSFWKFLRTIICNKHVAERVHEIRLGFWEERDYTSHKLTLTESDLVLVQDTIRATGLQQMEKVIIGSLKERDSSALLTLLLAALPNLRFLEADIEKTDIFFAGLLQIATKKQWHGKIQPKYTPLYCLREANLTVTELIDEASTVNWPYLVFQLPQLRKLNVYNMDTRGASEYSGTIAKSSSTITDLGITYTIFSWPLENSVEFLSFPEKLTKLSITLDSKDQWDAVRLHKDTLKDLYFCLSKICIYRDNNDNLFSGSMREFRNLKNLGIQAGVLFRLQARFGLSDSLPPNLASLAIYYGKEELSWNKTLAQCLQEVIKSGTFPYLSDITFGAEWELAYGGLDDLFPDEVRRACEETGIVFAIKDVLSGEDLTADQC
ncbi:hypothetical protein F5Y03DRAFT_361770 [Xylaria venustula]|nr:hypothetical protein F5Y03DRAFT_361770 [Xylaria venustula]